MRKKLPGTFKVQINTRTDKTIIQFMRKGKPSAGAIIIPAEK